VFNKRVHLLVERILKSL